MLEDLFKIVKTRSAQEPKAPGSKVNIPSNLLFKCPRCGAFTIVRAERPDSEPPDGQCRSCDC